MFVSVVGVCKTKQIKQSLGMQKYGGLSFHQKRENNNDVVWENDTKKKFLPFFFVRVSKKVFDVCVDFLFAIMRLKNF